MIIQHFNRLLEKYSHNLTFLRLKKNEISNHTIEQMLGYFATKDKE